MAEEGNSAGGRGVRVCVTGGAGFIGSWLVRKLLQAGYTAHATLRSVGDEGKAGLLRRLVPVAAPPERLVLFEADLYDAASFAPAIVGCQFVFLVATPFAHEAAASKYKTSAEAAADAVRVILRQCAESKTVKRVIHTASVSAASPLTKSSTAASAVYRDFISESCWTLLDVDYPLRNAHFDKYIESKLLSEKELLSYNDGENPAFEVVTLPLGLVAGDTVLGHLPETIESAVAPVTKQEPYFMLLHTVARKPPPTHSISKGLRSRYGSNPYPSAAARRRNTTAGRRSSAAGCPPAPPRGASSLRVKREPEELTPRRAVKREPEAEPERRSVIGPEDYLPSAEADVLEAAIFARSAWEQQEEEERRRRDVDINRIFLEQGFAAAQQFATNMEGWRLVAKKQDEVYVDLVSDNED